MINKERFYDRLKFVFAKNFAWLGSNPSYAPVVYPGSARAFK